MGFAALNPSYGTTETAVAPRAVGWVERSETHHRPSIRASTEAVHRTSGPVRINGHFHAIYHARLHAWTACLGSTAMARATGTRPSPSRGPAEHPQPTARTENDHDDRHCLTQVHGEDVCNGGRARTGGAWYPLRLAHGRAHIPLRRVLGRGDVHPRSPADTDFQRSRLVDRRTFGPARFAHDAVRPGRAVRGRADPSAWSAQGADVVGDCS